MVSIIIISYNTSQLTLNCIRSIYKTYPEGEIVVVDNRSPDDTVQRIQREYPQVRVVVTPENKSYSNAVNIGMNSTTSEYSIVCNADVEFFEKSIERLVGFLQTHPHVGVCSPQQQFPDGSWQYSYGALPSIRVALTDMIFWYSFTYALKKMSYKRNRLFTQPRKVGYCDGAVLALRRTAYDEIGGFDENFTFYAEEADYCYRLHMHGWGVYYAPSATVMHIRGASSGAEMNLSERAIRKLVASKVQYLQKHSNAFHLYWFIRCEILNYDIKSILSSLFLLVLRSERLKAKQKMFKDLARFYREVR